MHKKCFSKSQLALREISERVRTASVTRFGEISPLCQKFKSFGKFCKVYFVFGKILSLPWDSSILL